jgi:hypothetical protein
MKKQFAVSLILGAALAASASAAMADGIRVKAGLGTEQYASPSTNPDWPDYKVSGSVLTLGGSYVFTDLGVFVDFTNRSSLGSSTTWNAADFNPGLGISDQPAKFSDNTLTVGKMLGDGLFAFAGYQQQETTTQFDFNDGLGNIFASNDKATLSGYFAGAGKAFSVGPGWLTTTASLAMMGFNYSYSDNTPSSGSFSSDAGLGYSLGLSYSYPMTAQYDLVGEGKYQSYKPKDWTVANTVTVLGLNVVGKF